MSSIKKKYFLFTLLLFCYIIVHSIIFYFYISNNKIENINLSNSSTISIIGIVIFMSISTIFAVLMPKYIYFFIMVFIFNLPISKKNLLYFSLIGYIPVFLNTIIVNILDFYTNIKVNGFLRSEKDFNIIGLLKYYDIIDTIVVIIISYLITKKAKGSYRDFLILLIGWVFIRFIFFLIEVII